MQSNNIKPITDSETAKARGHNGGVRSGQVRREKRSLRESLINLLEYKNMEGSGYERAAIALFNKVLAGDTKAFELLRDSIGEKPIDRKEVSASFDVVNVLEEARKRASQRDVKAESPNPDSMA